MIQRRTKIVATAGPATDDVKVLRAVIAGGADVVRVSLAHGAVEDARRRISAVRAVEAELDRPIGVFVDLPGPKLRVRSFPDGGAWLGEGTTVELREGPDVRGSDSATIAVEGDGVITQLHPGDRVALGDGGVSLVVERVDAAALAAVAVVRNGGRLLGRPGLHLPASRIASSTPTPDDLRLLDGVLDAGIDAVAVSFVRAGDDVVRTRRACSGSGALVIAKIETQEAVDDLDEIVQAADVIMVARGDLGVRCRLEDVPHYQKRIIRTGIFYGRPVITATQMLESMVHAPVPTRAEVSDVANAVFDGTSALMLSAETAIGEDPAVVVRTMSTIAARAERDFDHVGWSSRLVAEQPTRLQQASPTQRITEATSAAAFRAAVDAGAVAIIACTSSGTTARVIARFRPPVPILAATPSEQTLRQLTLSWGVEPVLSERRTTTDEIVWFAVKEAVERGV
ncbi:MAG: pyruvate kinase, partial [Actinomycetota bacterium]|nr:pyruvate kinase [Actinomycetota bacterium]